MLEPGNPVHCELTEVTFAADVTRPYWSIVICEMLDDEPYVPAVTPDAGNTLVLKVPKATFEALRFERAEPSPIK
jgi:hypothetical protein